MTNNSRQRNDSNASEMQEIGFGLRPPLDGYSDQPDSGSAIGGVRGRQEYGITGGVADESDPQSFMDSVALMESLEMIDGDEVGISEYTDHSTRPPDAFDTTKKPSSSFSKAPIALRASIYTRLKAHHRIDASTIRVHVEDGGNVFLQGDSHSQSERDRIEDIVRSIPGVKSVTNHLGLL